MKNNQIRWLIITGAIAITGVLLVQLFWLRKAYDLRQGQFNYNVNLALKNVVESLCQYNGSDVPVENPIEQVSSNYFVVRTNDVIPPESLEYFLKAELQKRTINTNFEYTIYDCKNQHMVFSEYIDINKSEEIPRKSTLPPKFQENEYYFGVFFPNKTASIANQMGVWLISSIALLVVIVLFAFALFIIFRQKRLSEIQRDFVNNMAHEFKTPIATISLASDYIQKNSSNLEKTSNYASIIMRENQRLQNHVERVLEIAKPDMHNADLNIEALDLSQLINESIAHIKLTNSEKSISFKVDFGNANMIIKADKMHIYNVFQNLFENSVKYCNTDPEIKITIEENRHHLFVVLKDNGLGIPKKYQSRVFDRFFRVPKGETHDVKGFGIGLSYVKTILKQMGGAIKLFESNEAGSTFIIKISKN